MSSSKPIPEQLTEALALIATLQANDTALKAQLETANASVQGLSAEKTSLLAKIGTLEASVTDLTGKLTAATGEVTTLKASAKTASELAAEMASKAGVKPVQSDKKQGEEANAETLEQVQAKIATERDPIKRGQLAAQAVSLREKAAK